MRCPKCGFISFDHMETCLKCNKGISGGSAAQGTTYHAAAPAFLRVPEKNSVGPEFEEEEGITFAPDDDSSDESYDFADPDLDVLVDDGDDDDTATITFSDSETDEFQLDAGSLGDEGGGEEEGDFEFDLDDDMDFSDESETAVPTLDVSGELADISDLAPPASAAEDGPVAAVSDDLSLDLDMDMDSDLELGGLDLDLGLGDDESALDTDLSLSLDDIDLSSGDIVAENSDLDDLSMDLDLGGMDDSPAVEKEKAPGSLDGISLSLD